MKDETAQSIIDCSGRLSDLVKKLEESEHSVHPSKVSIDTYQSLASNSQLIDDFSSYKRNSENTDEDEKLEKT